MADGEAAIQALATAIKLHRKGETVVTGKPRHDSKPTGAVENANLMVKGLLRTWISSLEVRHKVEHESQHAFAQWAVRHCGLGLSRHSVADNWLTPFRSKFANKWIEGLWLCKVSSADVRVLGTE